MRVALNLMFLTPGLAGTRVYSNELLAALARSAPPDTSFLLFVRRDCELPDLPQPQFEVFRAPVGDGQLWRMYWEYARLPGCAAARQCDLLHGLGNVSPRIPNRPFVLTLHDLLYHHIPESYPLGYRLFMRTVAPRMARRADSVIVPSHCTARDAQEVYGVRPERIRVIPYGPGHGFRPPADPDQALPTLTRYQLTRPYVISVARAYRHKNLGGLIRAFARLPADVRGGTQLALVGDRHRLGPELCALAEQLGVADRIVFTGFVPQDDLRTLYGLASVFAFPSLAEGLGLPPLEAMACGVPVVVSDASAIPEAVGDAGLLADATDPEAFAAALGRVLTEPDLATRLRTRGLERAAAFSWDRAAADTLNVYREVH